MPPPQPRLRRHSFLSGWRVRLAIIRSEKRVAHGRELLEDDFEFLARAADGEPESRRRGRHERLLEEDRDAAERVLEAWWIRSGHPV